MVRRGAGVLFRPGNAALIRAVVTPGRSDPRAAEAGDSPKQMRSRAGSRRPAPPNSPRERRGAARAARSPAHVPRRVRGPLRPSWPHGRRSSRRDGGRWAVVLEPQRLAGLGACRPPLGKLLFRQGALRVCAPDGRVGGHAAAYCVGRSVKTRAVVHRGRQGFTGHSPRTAATHPARNTSESRGQSAEVFAWWLLAHMRPRPIRTLGSCRLAPRRDRATGRGPRDRRTHSRRRSPGPLRRNARQWPSPLDRPRGRPAGRVRLTMRARFWNFGTSCFRKHGRASRGSPGSGPKA